MNALQLVCEPQELAMRIATRLKFRQSSWVLLTLLIVPIPLVSAADALDDRMHAFMSDHHVP